jgi:preprotein translocase subunit SecA
MLKNIDTLWMDHLENMEHTQDSVRLRAYGQQDPLIEYKNEGHRMFKEMLTAVNYNIAGTIFKISAKQMPHQHTQSTPMILGGVPQGAAPSGGAHVGSIGRNDPCPCGSGKKYKKCHGA